MYLFVNLFQSILNQFLEYLHPILLIFFQPQMIRRAGYRAEAHIIMTEDGYLLILQVATILYLCC